MRRIFSLTAAAVLALTAVLAIPAIPALAATTYTWTGLGTDHTAWSNAQNWSPNGVPTTGDSVVVGSLSGEPSDITGIPTVSLASLTITETANNVYLDGAATSTVTVTHGLSWAGGAVSVPLTVAAGATAVISGQSAAAHEDTFGGGSGSVTALKRLTVKGDLTIAGIGTGGTLPPTLGLSGRDDIVVAVGGVLKTTGATSIQSDSCCVDHTATLQNFGTISATGPLLLDYLGLDQDGVFAITTGRRVQFYAGPMRSQGSTAAFSGGGTFEVVATDGDNYDPAHSDAPEYGWKLGYSGTTSHPAVVTLAAGTVLQLDRAATLRGVGSITGTGSVLLAGAHLQARVTLNVAVKTGATTSTTLNPVTHIDAWSQALVGEHGEVTLGRSAALAAGSSLQVDGPETLTVAGGGSLTVPGRAGITSGGCCANPARLTVNAGGTLTLGSTSGTALLQWVTLGGSGHLVLAGPSQWGLASVRLSASATITGHATVTGTFATYLASLSPSVAFAVHGTAGLTGTLATNAPVTATGAVTVGGTFRSSSGTAATISGLSITGRFACAYTPGRLPVYGTTKITLVGLGVTDTGCLVYAAGTRLNATFSRSKTFTVSLPSTAKRALLKVTVGAATMATSLKITAPGGGTATVAVPKTSAVTRYVIVAIGTNRTLTATLAAGSAKVTVAQAGSYH